MREIKFRAYHIEQKKMINIENLLSFSNDGDIWINENKQMPLNVFSGWASKDFKLMQYTGLKDKNGVEIYEGDIVAFDNNGFNDKGVVIYDGPCFIVEGFFLIDNSLKVIGNIYEKPELLN